MFITPNMVDDGHDTNVDFAGDWLQFWLVPLLSNPQFNNNRTLIVLTFDENETSDIDNKVYTLLLGGAVPVNLKNTTDTTYYSHYSCLSTVQANWGLGSLGRQDTNKTVSNVFSFVANATGYQNLNVALAEYPATNLSGVFNGPLNSNQYVPFLAPNLTAVGAGGGAVFVSPLINKSLTSLTAPAAVNLTALNESVPSSGPFANSTNSSSAPSPSGSSSGAAVTFGVDVRMTVFAMTAVVGGAIAGLL